MKVSTIITEGDILIEVERDGEITTIKLDNPPMNSVCKDMLEELEELLEDVPQEDTRVIILTGKGDAFVAGADIKEMKDMDPEEASYFSSKGQKLFEKFQEMTVPVIAAVNGYALGGGLELAMSCDFVIASKDALFGQPEVGLGVIPGYGGTYRLSKAVGPAKAKELIFTGKRIDAEEAKELGIVNHVTDDDELMDKVKEIAESISQNSPVAVAKAKRSIKRGLEVDREQAFRFESDRFKECFESPDQEEGMEAFLEKRDPDF